MSLFWTTRPKDNIEESKGTLGKAEAWGDGEWKNGAGHQPTLAAAAAAGPLYILCAACSMDSA
jgi:hypothetical protein